MSSRMKEVEAVDENGVGPCLIDDGISSEELAAARQIVQQRNAREASVKACMVEIGASLEKHKCRLQSIYQVVDGQPGQFQVNVVPVN